METEDLVRKAQLEFAAAQKRAGSADIVARVRRLPDGAIDVAFNRRSATQQRLRLGSIGGTHPELTRAANAIDRPAPKGSFYVLAVSAADDSDARVVIAPRAST